MGLDGDESEGAPPASRELRRETAGVVAAELLWLDGMAPPTACFFLIAAGVPTACSAAIKRSLRVKFSSACCPAAPAASSAACFDVEASLLLLFVDPADAAAEPLLPPLPEGLGGAAVAAAGDNGSPPFSTAPPW